MTKQKHNTTAILHTTKDTTKKITTGHKITSWTQYSYALEQRGNFTVLLNKAVLDATPEQSGKAGHPVQYSDAVILFLAQLREFMQLPLRQTIGMARFIFWQAGLELALPSYATLSRRMGVLKVPSYLSFSQSFSRAPFLSLLDHSAPPIIFLPDSTGLKLSGEGEWKVKKHGVEPGKRRQWLKVHLGTDYASRQIVAYRTSSSNEHDNQSLMPLLDALPSELALRLGQVIGDGAYDSETLYRAVEGRGATLLVPPPKNAKWHGDIKHGQLVDEPGWEQRNAYVRGCMRLGRKEWKRQSGYHRRSLAETSMFRLKRAFGSSLKSRKRANQDTEVAIRVSLLNLFTGYGLPTYQTAVT